MAAVAVRSRFWNTPASGALTRVMTMVIVLSAVNLFV